MRSLPPHIPEYCQFRLQTKQFHVILHTFSPSLPALSFTHHSCHFHTSTGYADDTQMIEQTTIPGIPGTILKLQSCIEATQEWCKSRRLQLNPAKTELIWFGSKTNLKKMADLDLNLYIGADVIKPSVSFVT